MLAPNIISPRDTDIFKDPQGSSFRSSYKATSSEGVRLRSKNECFWHFFLSALGIAHTYEPDIPNCNHRPDFGVANNFLFEICGAKAGQKFFGKTSKEYFDNVAQKREEYLQLGYNVIEVRHNFQRINGVFRPISIIDLINEHNSGFKQEPKIITFTPDVELKQRLYLSYK
ncbi:hypothetical protein KY315_04450, partial [Candidatus Woesearchaeota archaeon]|nr:hypothetical protein [Candidatus Woesearchaeota archaeon]